MLEFTRRQALMMAGAAAAVAQVPTRRIRLGVVGCGGRGAWIAGLFNQHGGYALHAVADYFPEVADACGKALAVDASRRFSGLDGYRRLMESGVEAVALETPPWFFPEHARAAVDAGLHVFMAKPVAVDVPGCLAIEQAARKAGAAGKVFMVDYQMPTDPHNVEVVRQVAAGVIGAPAALSSFYLAGNFPDPPLGKTIEDRLRGLVWVNDNALGGSYHVNACIHAVDAALWVAGQRPIAAQGVSRVGRTSPHGDSHDVYALVFEYANGLVHTHRGKHLPDKWSGEYCGCTVHGQAGWAQVTYSAKAQLVGSEAAVSEDVVNLYEAGARRNIAAFHTDVLEGRTANSTVRRSIDGCLATILGREAGRRRTRITMAQLLKERRALTVNLEGLKK